MNERVSRFDFVKQKYRLSELSFVDGESNGKKLGHGKVMADETFQRFVDADPSGTGKYLDWMLFMAGGGQEAMEKSLRLWEGDGPQDPKALRNQCHHDFVAEQTAGYTDDHHVPHPSVSAEEAEKNWRDCEESLRFEFLMGDQDIANENGYGFFRSWPGKNKLYERVINAVQFWHNAQQKLALQNQEMKRAERLRNGPISLWTNEDHKFMSDWAGGGTWIDLDIYSGWKPREYSQAKARYKSIDALLAPLKDIRKSQILKDERFDLVYEDQVMRVICPLTVGASLKYGCIKWCVSNRTDYDLSFEQQGQQHWKTYAEKGPLLFMLFKIAMPPYCHKLAVLLPTVSLANCSTYEVTDARWYDCKNEQTGTTRAILLGRIKNEHFTHFQPIDANDRALAYGDRPPANAWNHPAEGERVLASIAKATEAIAAWARKFDHRRIVVDYLATAIGAASVIKSNE